MRAPARGTLQSIGSRSYTQADLEQAVEALADADRFREAERVVSAAAPGLQTILTEALASAGWFEDSHQQQLVKAAAIEDPGERLRALRTMLAEETRVAMMIGAAAGWTLNSELSQDPQTPQEED